MPLAFAAAIVPLLITSASAGQYPGTSITIDNYTTIVIRVDDAMLKGLRRTMNTQTISSDLDALIRLNADYIESVKKSDVGRFREILADDFLCSLPDGTLIDREQFLAQTAKPYTLGHLEAHDVNVRVLGDVAIVHATTLFWSTSTTLTSMTETGAC